MSTHQSKDKRESAPIDCSQNQGEKRDFAIRLPTAPTMTHDELVASLKKLGLENQTQASRILGVTRVHMNRLVRGHCDATGPLALLIREKLSHHSSLDSIDPLWAELEEIGRALKTLTPPKRTAAIDTLRVLVKALTL